MTNRAWGTSLIVLLLYASVATAERTPSVGRGSHDNRIRTVTYNEKDVVTLRGRPGEAITIFFERGEELVKWFAGDSQAWEVASHDNAIVLKPKSLDAETNIVVFTTKRHYYFRAEVTENNPFYEITFNYGAKKSKQDQALRRLKGSLDPERQTYRNKHYFAAGSPEIVPTEMWDNGSHTFIRFGANQKMPAIFAGNPESTTNPVVKGAWVVLPRVERKWTLRLGEQVACIKNARFAPYDRVSTNTSADDVFRGNY